MFQLIAIIAAIFMTVLTIGCYRDMVNKQYTRIEQWDAQQDKAANFVLCLVILFLLLAALWGHS